MFNSARDYPAFLARLRNYERVEAFPQSRRPDKLAGIRKLLEDLRHPEADLLVAHVAGTNGKGMTSAMLAAILKQAGHRAGLYTSPHVVDVRERIVLDGRWISESAFASAGHRVLDAADAARDSVYFSYFDVLTAIGVFAFHEAGCKWAVLETGMGGLSDATNAIGKRAAILTRIGFDHMYVLGNTLREIAGQKLGIVRPGIPAVLGAQEPDLQDWMEEQILARGGLLRRAFEILVEFPQGNGSSVTAKWPDGRQAGADVPGASLTRIKAICAANALCAADAILGSADERERANRLRSAMTTELPGRLERRANQRIEGTAIVLRHLVLDGGHNAGALHALGDQLQRWKTAGYTLIIGLQSDKLVPEVREAVGRILSDASRVIILAPQTARAPTAEALEAFLRSAFPAGCAIPIQVAPDPMGALMAAGETPDIPLVATGSFWMLGDLMRLLIPAS